MIKWRATGKTVKANGEKTVFYHADGVPYWIESRRRWIQNNKNNDQRLFCRRYGYDPVSGAGKRSVRQG